ncbi:MAG TPA: TIGR03986 family CRISPR-associated RAMP protein, partial [candidate division Zixibacteria bacterium]|nr:TIGR03986 family CRISPR-associated RAMP protein [candidate division Zixibacteria bacterium]
YIRDTSGKSVFFSPGDIVKIPGSSIRGMTRTLVEIVSWGKFRFFEDRKRLYYRGLADVGSLRRNYNDKITNAKAGYLNYDLNRKSYYIQPAKEKNGETYSQIKDNREFKIEQQSDGTYILCTGKMQGKEKNWLINQPDKDAQIVSLSNKDIDDYKKDSNRNIKWDLLNMAKDKKRYPDEVPCFYTEYSAVKGERRVAFGHTRYFRLPYELTIGEHVPGNLQQEDTVDLPEALFGRESKWATRVFFEDAEIKSEQDDIPEETSPKILSSPKPTTFQHYLIQPDGVSRDNRKHWNDRDAAIRGYKLYWHRNTDQNSQYDWKTSEIDVNENDFKKFLKFKKGANLNELIHDLNFVTVGNDRIKIRSSFYNIPNCEFKNFLREYLLASENLKEKAGIKGAQYTLIQAIKPEVRFKGKIRFENLSDIELGALLFVLNLQGNCFHKLGMAKPLGLGSVEIKPDLWIINRKKRYESLFNNNERWNIEEKETDTRQFSSAFEKFVLNHIPDVDKDNAVNLWDTPRLKTLKTMLDWGKTQKENRLERTRYKEIKHPENGNEFRNRPVLPEPEKIIE